MQTLRIVNYVIALIFTICYAYQFFYIPVVLFRKKIFRRKEKAAAQGTAAEKACEFAVLICARNEEAVIGDLLASIRRQTYPAEHIHVFVMADNCTDGTAMAARKGGAVVYTRSDSRQIGKGYALDLLLRNIRRDHPEGFDGYFVFDADNLLRPDYIEKMKDTYLAGNDIITSYRNSKNYGSNWISAGYALWFMRESRYLNHARNLLASSCAVSGTGFFFSRKIREEMEGWPYHLLTEDIEFSASQIVRGRKIAFCEEAELFDEQPVTFSQSWKQRLRWSKGYLQVIRKYGVPLLGGIGHGSFSCFDMTMNIMPAFFLTAISVISNITLGCIGAVKGDDIMIAVNSVFETLRNMYGLLFVLGALTTVTEWKRIHTSAVKKILYSFTFPVFMATYIPIAFTSLFARCSWQPIHHTFSGDRLTGLPEEICVARNAMRRGAA